VHIYIFFVCSFKSASVKFHEEVESAIREKNDIELRDLNDRMVNVEKSFIYSRGLPDQKFTRHVIFSPPFNNKYASVYFPGISDLMFLSNKTENDWKNIKRQISIVFKSIMSAAETLNKDAK
jgi:N-acetylated-alpha-linked acidic dipeptidase